MMLDPSRMKNVQDFLEKELRDVLVARHGPGFTHLRRCGPPHGLPQQSDAINCGLFVTLYAIHLVFLQERPSPEAIAALAAASAAASAASAASLLPDDFHVNDKGFACLRRTSGRLREAHMSKAQGALDAVPVCCFRHEREDIFKYRLLLLAWILHSQTSQLPRTEPVLLHHVRTRVGIGGGDGGDGGFVAPEALGCNTIEARRKVLLALLRDDAPTRDRTELLRAGMRLLTLFHQKAGTVSFLPPQFFDLARQGRGAEACELLHKEVEGLQQVEQLVAPVLLPAGQGALLARIALTVDEETGFGKGMVYLHGSNALAHADHTVIPPLIAALSHDELGMQGSFQPSQVPATRAPEKRMEDVLLLLMAMQTGHRGSACLHTAELYPGGGPDLASPGRLWAARVALLRWFLRHTNW